MPRFVFCLIIFTITIVLAQDILTLGELAGFHDYFDNPIPNNLSFAYASDPEAEEAIRQIMSFTGLPTNFKIMSAGVANAQAVIREETGEQLILYNQEFIQEIRQDTSTGWSATSIMAHEIGHHLAGHTTKLVLVGAGGIGDSRPLELEADRFSGFVLQKMGASLNEAQVAIETLIEESASSTHPLKADRLAAISHGWYAASKGESPFVIAGENNKEVAQRSIVVEETQDNLDIGNEEDNNPPSDPQINSDPSRFGFVFEETPSTSSTTYPCKGQIVFSTGALLNAVWTGPSGMSVRTTPIKQGSDVDIYQQLSTEGKEWYKITYNDGRYGGWIENDYVIPSSHCP